MRKNKIKENKFLKWLFAGSLAFNIFTHLGWKGWQWLAPVWASLTLLNTVVLVVTLVLLVERAVEGGGRG